jgi:DNA helicase II / ATP-dependent DNA helicase PcrA
MSALFEVPPHGPLPPKEHMPEALLEALNPQQRQAVLHTGSPLLIVAGAGSGKTKVLTTRIAYLLAERDVHPAQIMAITFTNKAAAEMKHRVSALVGRRANAMWVFTFHAMCVRIMRRDAKHLGLSSSFSIYDQDDSRRLVSLVARDLDLDPKRYSARGLAAQISNLKNELLDPDDASGRATTDFERRVAEVYHGYQRRLEEANALDFDDLIMRTVELLTVFPEVAEHYRRRFRHVMVDEYQDTNHAQYVLVRELVAPADDEHEPAELCVVGDADQAIYAFRGATIRNITEFERDFPNARTIMLEQNYRSTQTILSAANAVISRNTDRKDKRLWSDAGAGEKIVGYVADNEHDEAAFVASEIDRLVDLGEAVFGDIAVFYRTNSASRVFEEVFIRLGLPYRVVGGVRFYERREIKDALAYLRVLDNPDDAVSLRRILNTPRRGIGERAETCVAAHAERERISFTQALRAAVVGDVPQLAPRSQHAIADFVALWDELRDLVVAHREPAEILEAVLSRTGYRTELERTAEDDPQDASRLDNLTELVNVAREFAEQGPLTALSTVDGLEAGSLEASLGAFLERVSLVADSDSVPDSGDGVVTLMTLHTAKGLEFPVVFCTGWEDGVFPHQRALGDQRELAEERRLAYVGITRARQRLYLSWAVVRAAWGQPMANPASRFIDDLPPSLIDWRRTAPVRSAPVGRSSFGRLNQDVGGPDVGDSDPAQLATRRMPYKGSYKGGESRAAGPVLSLEVGDRVSHDKYGLGTVIATDGSGAMANVTIDFGTGSSIRILLRGGPPMVKL